MESDVSLATQEGALDMAIKIATETAMESTCHKAYMDDAGHRLQTVQRFRIAILRIED